MKILVINNNFFLRGGAERAFFDMINVLEKRGHNVAHFATKTKEDLDSPWQKHFVKYNELSDSSKFGVLEKIKIVFRIWYNFETRRNLRALIKEFGPDVAHLHNIFHHLSPSVIHELKSHGIPIVWTLHDYKMVSPSYDLSVRGNIWEENKNGKMHKCITHKCVYDSYLKSTVCVVESLLHRALGTFKEVDQFISPSDFLINKYGEFGFKGKIKKIANPVLLRDVNLDLEPWKLGIGDHKAGFLLYFGRLSFGKGLRDLIEAYAGLGTNMSLLIAGDGPDKESLSLFARKLNVHHKVKFLGKLSVDKLFPIIARSELVVMPSRLYENAPYGILEALALAKPVVASNLGGSKELVERSGAGILFETGNVKDLRMKLKFAIENKEIFRQKGLQGKKFIDEHYGEEVFYENIMDIYQKLVNRQ